MLGGFQCNGVAELGWKLHHMTLDGLVSMHTETLTIVCSALLSVLHRAVIPEWSVEHLIHRRVLPKRLFPQLNTEARALWDNQIAMLKPEWLLQELALGRFRLARIFLQGKVGDTGIELDAGSSADR